MNFVSGGRMTKLYIVKAEINESAEQDRQSQALSHHSLQLSSVAGAELSTCHCPTHQVTAALRFEKRDCRCLGKTIMPNTKHHRHKDERCLKLPLPLSAQSVSAACAVRAAATECYCYIAAACQPLVDKQGNNRFLMTMPRQ